MLNRRFIKPYAPPVRNGSGGEGGSLASDAAEILPDVLQVSYDVHERTDEGHEVAALMRGIMTGNLQQTDREVIRGLGELAAKTVQMLAALGSQPEAQAALAMVMSSLGFN